MAYDVFTVFSEDSEDRRYGATCMVSLEPDKSGRHSYRVVHTTSGTFGWARSLDEARARSEEAAKEHFAYKVAEYHIRAVKEALGRLLARLEPQ